jgi:hypothetical protein
MQSATALVDIGIRKMGRKAGDAPAGETVGDIKHLGYEASHFEEILSNGGRKACAELEQSEFSKLLSCVIY